MENFMDMGAEMETDMETEDCLLVEYWENGLSYEDFEEEYKIIRKIDDEIDFRELRRELEEVSFMPSDIPLEVLGQEVLYAYQIEDDDDDEYSNSSLTYYIIGVEDNRQENLDRTMSYIMELSKERFGEDRFHNYNNLSHFLKLDEDYCIEEVNAVIYDKTTDSFKTEGIMSLGYEDLFDELGARETIYQLLRKIEGKTVFYIKGNRESITNSKLLNLDEEKIGDLELIYEIIITPRDIITEF